MSSSSRPDPGPDPGTGEISDMSHPNEHTPRLLTGRLCDHGRVQRDLSTVAIEILGRRNW